MSEAEPRRALFVTGAASGIGRATALYFAERGWRVGAYDVDVAGLRALEGEIGPSHLVRPLDVADRAAFAPALDEFAAWTGGRLDLLFNNAGVIAVQRFDEMAWETVERIVRINLMGVLIGVHAATPLLKSTPGSLCLSTSSASAVFGSEYLAVYSATKQAVKGLTEALSIELGRTGVRVADVLPGIIDTGMTPPDRKASYPATGPWRMLTPEAVAETAWRAYHEDRVHWYVPPELKDLHVDAITEPETAREMFRRAGDAAAATS